MEFGAVVLFDISNSGFLSSASLLLPGLGTEILVLDMKLAQRFAAVGRAARWSLGVHSNQIHLVNLKPKICGEGRKRQNLSEPPLLQKSSQMLVVSVKSQSVQCHISFFAIGSVVHLNVMHSTTCQYICCKQILLYKNTSSSSDFTLLGKAAHWRDPVK